MSKGVIAIGILVAAGCINPARGQAPATTLYIELQNVVEYQVDTSDLSKYGTDPNVTQGKIAKGMGVGCAGVPVVGYADIVSVNGQPARGSYAVRGTSVCLSTTPLPRLQTISASTWNSKRDETFEISQSDGTPIGTIMTIGLNSGSPTPAGPLVGGRNYAIVGGTAHSSAFEGKEARETIC